VLQVATVTRVIGVWGQLHIKIICRSPLAHCMRTNGNLVEYHQPATRWLWQMNKWTHTTYSTASSGRIGPASGSSSYGRHTAGMYTRHLTGPLKLGSCRLLAATASLTTKRGSLLDCKCLRSRHIRESSSRVSSPNKSSWRWTTYLRSIRDAAWSAQWPLFLYPLGQKSKSLRLWIHCM